METVSDFYKALKAPFPTDEVQWRLGMLTKDKKRGQVLAYIDARTVFDRLDAVCGGFGWQCNYSHASSKDTKTICNLGLFMPMGPMSMPLEEASFQWIWRADGAGDTDFEGEKGAISDALKRAAVRFGIGRYLYELPAPWVTVVERGTSQIIDPNELPKLKAELEKVGKSAGYSAPQMSDQTSLNIAIKALQTINNEDGLLKFGQDNASLIGKLDEKSKEKFRAAYAASLKQVKNQNTENHAN